MTAFDQELTRLYVPSGAERPDIDARRVARAVLVCDTVRTIHAADKKSGIDPTDLGSLAELGAAAEEHLEHISHNVGQPSPMAPPASSKGAIA